MSIFIRAAALMTTLVGSFANPDTGKIGRVIRQPVEGLPGKFSLRWLPSSSAGPPPGSYARRNQRKVRKSQRRANAAHKRYAFS